MQRRNGREVCPDAEKALSISKSHKGMVYMFLYAHHDYGRDEGHVKGARDVEVRGRQEGRPGAGPSARGRARGRGRLPGWRQVALERADN